MYPLHDLTHDLTESQKAVNLFWSCANEIHQSPANQYWRNLMETAYQKCVALKVDTYDMLIANLINQ